MKNKLAILTIVAMFFGALGLGMVIFPNEAWAPPVKCEIVHADGGSKSEANEVGSTGFAVCDTETKCVSHSTLKRADKGHAHSSGHGHAV